MLFTSIRWLHCCDAESLLNEGGKRKRKKDLKHTTVGPKEKIRKSKTEGLQIAFAVFAFTLYTIHDRSMSTLCYCCWPTDLSPLLAVTSSRANIVMLRVVLHVTAPGGRSGLKNEGGV